MCCPHPQEPCTSPSRRRRIEPLAEAHTTRRHLDHVGVSAPPERERPRDRRAWRPRRRRNGSADVGRAIARRQRAPPASELDHELYRVASSITGFGLAIVHDSSARSSAARLRPCSAASWGPAVSLAAILLLAAMAVTTCRRRWVRLAGRSRVGTPPRAGSEHILAPARGRGLDTSALACPRAEPRSIDSMAVAAEPASSFTIKTRAQIVRRPASRPRARDHPVAAGPPTAVRARRALYFLCMTSPQRA